MLGPFTDRIWLHLGARVPEHAPRLAELVGGAVLQGPLKEQRAVSLAHSGVPTI